MNVEKDPHKRFDPRKEASINLEKLPRIAKPGLGALVEPKWPKDRSVSMFSVPPPPDQQGLLRVKFSVASYSAFSDVPNPVLWIKIGGRVLDRREITGPVDLEYEVQVEDTIIGRKGLSIGFTPRVEIAYRVKGFENEDRSKPKDLPNGAGLFRPAWDKKKLRKPEQQPRPFVVVKSVELEPRFVAAWPPAKWNVDLGEIGDNSKSAEKLLALWMDRAYRRPATSSEKKPFLAFYKKLRGDGMTFDNALRSTFQSVLLSSPFRYLDSTAHEDKVIAVHAVASRLSFMLVGTPPDAELRKLAASGKLRKPDVLKAQIERLLNDFRNYDAFLRPFVTQWLELEQPITLVDDRRGKASYRFRRHLQDSMREETFSYIAHMLSRKPAGTGVGVQRLDHDERRAVAPLRLQGHRRRSPPQGESAQGRQARRRSHVACWNPVHALLDGRQLGDLPRGLDRAPHSRRPASASAPGSARAGSHGRETTNTSPRGS